MSRGIRPTTGRSIKAGRPPVKAPANTGHVALSKSTHVRGTDDGPRAAWSGSKPTWKKR